MPERRSTFDLVESFQLAHAVVALRRLGLLARMRRPSTVDDLASSCGVDPGILRGTLEFVASRTNLVRRTGSRFAITRESSPASDFLLEQYVHTYGKNAAMLATTLRDPSKASKWTNRAGHARAFEAVAESALGPFPEIIRQLEFNHVLDLGCGPGSLLIDLARNNREFVGWGIDRNRSMCLAARRRIRSAGVGTRVRVFEGDCFELECRLPDAVRTAVAGVTACDVVNEISSHGGLRIMEWLRRLGTIVPGRPMVIADYYGRLGTNKRGASPESLLHDYTQLISGQGIPPADAEAWRAIYAKAGCRLAHVIEDRVTTRFVHILKLPETAA